jgi:hypothetical protein
MEPSQLKPLLYIICSNKMEEKDHNAKDNEQQHKSSMKTI